MQISSCKTLALVVLGVLAVAVTGSAGHGEGGVTQTSSRPLAKLASPPLMATGGVHAGYTLQMSPELAATPDPAEVMVYQVVHKPPTREMACDLAARVGVPVPEARRAMMVETAGAERGYSVTVGELTKDSLGDLDVLLQDDGNYALTFLSRVPERSQDKLVAAPGDEAARAAAEAFLASSGVLPEGCRFSSVRPGEAVESTGQGGEIKETMIGKAVIYNRYLGGLSDGVYDLRLNGAGKVYSVLRKMREVIPLAPYPVLSRAEALAAVQAGKGSVTGPYGPNGPYPVTVDRIEMVYNEGSVGMPMDTVQPYYLISGAVEGFSERFGAVLPAVRPEYLN